MNKVRRWLRSIGPGFITGASDDDCSGIGAYSQTGAQFGYSQLWTALFSTPLMIAVQEMCGRIGLVTGNGLAAAIRTRFGRNILILAVLLLSVANIFNIGADLGAMAATAELLWNLPKWFWLVAIAFVSVLLEIFISYRKYQKFLKYFALSLLAYVAVAFLIPQNWGEVFRATFIPNISASRDFWMNIVAILGTTISPYLFFWQSDEEIENEIIENKLADIGAARPDVSDGDLKTMRADTFVGMLFSNVVMFFIIIATAATLNRAGIFQVDSAAKAAEALRPLAGNFTFALFALGIIGIGFLAIPVLAGSVSYAVSELFGWREGLSRKYSQARGFYGVIAVATLVGLLINALPIPAFTLLYYAAVLNGLLAPPLIVLIVLVAGNEKIMGRFRSSRLISVLGWLAALVMAVAGVAMFVL